jgi:hypothetical protein
MKKGVRIISRLERREGNYQRFHLKGSFLEKSGELNFKLEKNKRRQRYGAHRITPYSTQDIHNLIWGPVNV